MTDLPPDRREIRVAQLITCLTMMLLQVTVWGSWVLYGRFAEFHDCR